MTEFASLGLIEPICRAVAAEGYTSPTPIQAQAIPALLEGNDLLGIAQTGTGKTAAFTLPILQHLTEDTRRAGPKSMRALILAPTRELAIQIHESFQTYGKNLKLRATVIFGGVGQNPQVRALARGIDVVIATPGRLLDLMNQGHVALGDVDVFVLDEADRMLDMGFITDVKKIAAKLPKDRQTLLFSATMPQAITGLAQGLLDDPVRVEVTPAATTVERIDQRVLFVGRGTKRELLRDVLAPREVTRAIVFTRTKHLANRVAEYLEKAGIRADAIHGNKSQGARQRALQAFRDGKVKALVATDIAARGIDVDGVSHVINFDLPVEPEAYVHRIGRTARAGAEGVAISFCDADEIGALQQIERTIRMAVPMDADHDYHDAALAETRNERQPGKPGRAGGGRGRGQGQGHGQGGKPQGGRKFGGGKGFGGGKPQHAKGQGGEAANRNRDGGRSGGQSGSQARRPARRVA